MCERQIKRILKTLETTGDIVVLNHGLGRGNSAVYHLPKYAVRAYDTAAYSHVLSRSKGDISRRKEDISGNDSDVKGDISESEKGTFFTGKGDISDSALIGNESSGNHQFFGQAEPENTQGSDVSEGEIAAAEEQGATPPVPEPENGADGGDEKPKGKGRGVRKNETPEEREKRKTRLPANFAPTESTLASAAKRFPNVNVDDQLAIFVGYYQAHGTPMLNWQAAFLTWINKADQYAKERDRRFGGSGNGSYQNLNGHGAGMTPRPAYKEWKGDD